MNVIKKYVIITQEAHKLSHQHSAPKREIFQNKYLTLELSACL